MLNYTTPLKCNNYNNTHCKNQKYTQKLYIKIEYYLVIYILARKYYNNNCLLILFLD